MRRSFLTALSGAALLMLGTNTSAQLTDLQSGRNFPTGSAAFGTGRSENIDLGDVDNDGDYDVIVGNGGDGTAQDNRIYINNGGIQGGTPGTFSDLDIYVSNRGNTVNRGEVSRFYRNQGGAQNGSVGFFTENTNAFWGSLISVPGSAQVFGGNVGPWRDFSCDCDFGDLNLDGDIDLFHSSYGPNINGTADSRLFLNDGTGVFDELWPWINAGGDIRLHTLDIDLVDLDGDFDLDVFASSRDSQARVYRNNLNVATMSWSGSPFNDITETGLLNQGAVLTGSNNYEAEPGDVDGDGDFDIWMKNYNGNLDRILRNNGNLTFTQMNAWIKGDPNQDENEIDFIDFDSDGDLDAFAANFSGTNRLYTSGLAQGLDPSTQGYYHRNGTTNGGSLASWEELPASGNGNITLDGEVADMDGDGDPDLLLANDQNAQNRYFQNVLGVPDTHAPTIALITNQGNKSDGSDTIIRAQLRDNAPYYVIGYYGVDLIYTVNGGVENRIRMESSQGQQFQAAIPGGINGAISYRVEGSDDHGNAFASSTFNYNQSSSGVTLLQNIDSGISGVYGKPYLEFGGSFVGGTVVSSSLCDASPNSIAVLFFSFTSTPSPFKGGTLYTIPIDGQLDLATDAGGQVYFQATWPVGLPSGVDIWYQYGIQDGTAPKGATLSNAVKNTLP